MTAAWPNGKVHLIVKTLLQKFRPHDAMSELEFSEAVMQMQLHPGDNPTDFFSQLADIENRFGIHNYSEQQVIAAIMRLIPGDYRASVPTEMQKRSIVRWDQRYNRCDHLLFLVVVNPKTVLDDGQLGEELRWIVTWSKLHLHDSFRELQLAHCVMGTKLLEQSPDDQMDFAMSCSHLYNEKRVNDILRKR
jgi:hypothetical protein